MCNVNNGWYCFQQSLLLQPHILVFIFAYLLETKMQIVLDAFETPAATCMAINTCIREILSHTTDYPENLDLQCQLSNNFANGACVLVA